ncbi:MAG: hypothetical protein PHR24_06135 [Oscillospiraceae bacterium]|nr:hypothetical protein [Oscillospiraceae bacterium]
MNQTYPGANSGSLTKIVKDGNHASPLGYLALTQAVNLLCMSFIAVFLPTGE